MRSDDTRVLVGPIAVRIDFDYYWFVELVEHCLRAHHACIVLLAWRASPKVRKHSRICGKLESIPRWTRPDLRFVALWDLFVLLWGRCFFLRLFEPNRLAGRTIEALDSDLRLVMLPGLCIIFGRFMAFVWPLPVWTTFCRYGEIFLFLTSSCFSFLKTRTNGRNYFCPVALAPNEIYPLLSISLKYFSTSKFS